MSLEHFPPDFNDESVYPQDGKVIVLTGASGSGKSTALGNVLATGSPNPIDGFEGIDAYYSQLVGRLAPYPTYTTRANRGGEEDRHYDHVFVSDEEFTRMKERGHFLLTLDSGSRQDGMPKLQRTFYAHQGEWILREPQTPIVIGNIFLANAIGTIYPKTVALEIMLPAQERAARLQDRSDAGSLQSVRDQLDRALSQPAKVPVFRYHSSPYRSSPETMEEDLEIARDYLRVQIDRILDTSFDDIVELQKQIGLEEATL